MADLTYAQVSALLKYESETGKLFWLPRSLDMFNSERYCKVWHANYAGKEAFTSVANSLSKKSGKHACYKQGGILGKRYLAHRVAWLLHYGEWPKDVIDHINGDGTDNRIANLRDVSVSMNRRNSSISTRNSSGSCGVSFEKRTGRWQAGMGVDGKYVHLGTFATKEQAIAARSTANANNGFTSRHGL